MAPVPARLIFINAPDCVGGWSSGVGALPTSQPSIVHKKTARVEMRAGRRRLARPADPPNASRNRIRPAASRLLALGVGLSDWPVRGPEPDAQSPMPYVSAQLQYNRIGLSTSSFLCSPGVP